MQYGTIESFDCFHIILILMKDNIEVNWLAITSSQFEPITNLFTNKHSACVIVIPSYMEDNENHCQVF